MADTAVGVPVICPVDVLKDNPAGRAGPIDQLVAVPPAFVGVHVVMACPTVNVFVEGL